MFDLFIKTESDWFYKNSLLRKIQSREWKQPLVLSDRTRCIYRISYT